MTARSTIAVLLVLAGTRTVLGQAPKPAEPAVAARNRAVLSELPFSDRQDFEDAMRGFVATVPTPATRSSTSSCRAMRHRQSIPACGGSRS